MRSVPGFAESLPRGARSVPGSGGHLENLPLVDDPVARPVVADSYEYAIVEEVPAIGAPIAVVIELDAAAFAIGEEVDLVGRSVSVHVDLTADDHAGLEVGDDTAVSEVPTVDLLAAQPLPGVVVPDHVLVAVVVQVELGTDEAGALDAGGREAGYVDNLLAVFVQGLEELHDIGDAITIRVEVAHKEAVIVEVRADDQLGGHANRRRGLGSAAGREGGRREEGGEESDEGETHAAPGTGGTRFNGQTVSLSRPVEQGSGVAPTAGRVASGVAEKPGPRETGKACVRGGVVGSGVRRRQGVRGCAEGAGFG